MIGENDAFAVSVETGAVLWEYRANIDPKVARPAAPGRVVANGRNPMRPFGSALSAQDRKDLVACVLQLSKP